MRLTVESFVGYPPSDDLLVALETDARRRQLHLQIERRDITTTLALDDVRQGAADMCLVSHLGERDSGELDFTSLECERLTQDRLVAIVRDDHPLADRSTIRIAQIGSDVVWTCTSPGVRMYFSAMEQLLVRNGANPRFISLPWKNAQQLYNSFAFFEGGIHVNLASVVRHSVPLLLQGYRVLRIEDDEAVVPMYAHWRTDSDNPAVPLAIEAFRSTIERLGENPWG